MRLKVPAQHPFKLHQASSGHEDLGKSTITEKVLAVWLKHDPVVRFVAGNNEEIRRDAMLALLGEKAAKRYAKTHPVPPTPLAIHPSHVREKEQEFLDHPANRSKIIHELVYWGSDEAINKENPDSYKTRIQIIHSLLGPLLMNANEDQEKLMVEGIKVLVITRPTSLGKQGEASPAVHHEILQKISELLRYNQEVVANQAVGFTEKALKAQLIKTIQGLKDQGHRSAYYVADDQARRKKIIAEKFPLKPATYQGLLEIVRHYTFSAWSEARAHATKLLQDLHETPHGEPDRTIDT